MRVDQFGELGKDFHNLIRTFTAGSDNNDIGFGLFGDSVLKHGLTRTERTGDKSRTAFYDRVYRIDGTNTCFQQFVWTRFFFVTSDGSLYRPTLYHIHIDILTIFVSQNGNRLINGILSGFHQALYSISSFKRERHHDLVRLEVFIHFAQPVTCGHLITHFRQRFEVPQFIVIQCKCIFTTFQEHAVHFIQVILQTVVVARQHTRPQCYFKHVPFKLGFVTYTHPTCTFKYLNKGILPYYFNNLRHQLHASYGNVTDFILRNRPIHLYGYQVGYDSFYNSFRSHNYLLLFLLNSSNAFSLPCFIAPTISRKVFSPVTLSRVTQRSIISSFSK